jgi:hypothetical protein
MAKKAAKKAVKKAAKKTPLPSIEVDPLAALKKHNELLQEALMAAPVGLDEDPLKWHKRGIAVALKALQQGVILPKPADQGKDLSVLAQLRSYVIGCEVIIEDSDILNGTYESLDGVAGALAAAHRTAAAVKVDAPSEAEVAAIMADLTKLSDAIKQDQRFSASLSLLEAAAKAYGSSI